MLTAVWRIREWYRHWYRHLIEPVFPFPNLFSTLVLYTRYLSSWRQYRTLTGAEPLRLYDSFPCLFDAEKATRYDPHYFYQAVWAMERIVQCGTSRHIDIGSDIKFVGMLTACVPVAFLDFRAFSARLPRLARLSGNILALPLKDYSVHSLSCLHVAEHVGLGRYGDPLNPLGTRQACDELKRVMAPHANLFFSIPLGRPRVCFNAHRTHSIEQVLDYFYGLELVEFSTVDDEGNYLVGAPFDTVKDAVFGCGFFWFRKGSITSA